MTPHFEKTDDISSTVASGGRDVTYTAEFLRGGLGSSFRFLLLLMGGDVGAEVLGEVILASVGARWEDDLGELSVELLEGLDCGGVNCFNCLAMRAAHMQSAAASGDPARQPNLVDEQCFHILMGLSGQIEPHNRPARLVRLSAIA